MTHTTAEPADREVAQPLVESWGWTRTLFAARNPVSGVVWLVVRVLLGWQWIDAAVGKFGNYGPWSSGAAVQGFAKGALGNMTGEHPSVIAGTFGWNKAWLTWMADSGYRFIGPIIPFVEITVGTLLILGLFTGIAAALGLTLNLSFLFAGSAGVNPAFALTAIALIAAWRVAGHYGLDHWVLPLVGVPGVRRRGRAEAEAV
ncbi:hypothetical protein Q6348_07225 [Isoptericola sp. b441]|uniref:DoxX family protein n=1 Tax=Actinotalea lenta TaxID=3064654 RepID=A0ABT9DA29_9CELL|nr:MULTISPECIES: hypothetical protein [unclassified Isoptericola]MDO8106988.1 hypothetical protein [Isoptericola sp. b441]MDO8121302.1 hypothetical protein [Isoptericola sp. b490]